MLRLPAFSGDPLRSRIRLLHRSDEREAVLALLGEDRAARPSTRRAETHAAALIDAVREKQRERAGVHALLGEYSLSSREGVLLMCLAEALLRVPDALTADRLIRDKLSEGDWRAHVGNPDLFVNASAWGLLLTGRFVQLQQDGRDSAWRALTQTVARAGEPAIRAAMRLAMRLMGTQFVLGIDIESALEKSAEWIERGYRYSYDMLGEAARTAEYAREYFHGYQRAIEAVGRAAAGADPSERAGFSVKLSALHPRFELAQAERVRAELCPRVLELARLARRHGLGLTIDAEEARGLELALDVFERVFADDSLSGWDGLGLAVQAYLKNAPGVIDWLAEQAARRGRRIPVRLVKGAYWDAEIKHAQVHGLPGYPVFTRKAGSDLSYLVCARRLLERRDRCFPQFATHNAHSAASVLELAGGRGGFEFQRLHGMGEELYEELRREGGPEPACRIYAPVGVHRDLLAYLVRRLLENGANSSFVHNLADESVPTASLADDPRDRLEGRRHPANPGIPRPPELFGPARPNSSGLDLADVDVLRQLATELEGVRPAIARVGCERTAGTLPVTNPARRGELLGHYRPSDPDEIERALERAHRAFSHWEGTPVKARADRLRAAADLMERHRSELIGFCVKEAGKTLRDSLAEVREAIDFCRYYAEQAERLFARDAGLRSRGCFLCISPWNFPAAIFIGQLAAALAAGNTVLAKPAEQTTLLALRLVELLHEAGVPEAALAVLRGEGRPIAERILPDPRLAGVIFTGSTEVGRSLARALAAREGPRLPLIAETGGLNALVVDSTALPEQVVDDVLTSGFNSAGQRCSALRVLYLQREIAEPLLEMLVGAMRELRVGDPAELSTDVGPIIDEEARERLETHVARLRSHAELHFACEPPAGGADGSFFPPRLYEIDSIERLPEEVFGPIVHVVRYSAEELEELPSHINASGYGLTFGVHSRIQSSVDLLAHRIGAGNVYVNRNLIGAVVGVQPFGGRALSGTGPKAGGPHYLERLVRSEGGLATPSAPPAPPAETAAGSRAPRGEPVLRSLRESLEAGALAEPASRLAALGRLAARVEDDRLFAKGERDVVASRLRALLDRAGELAVPAELPGPTGESNTLLHQARGLMVCPSRGDACPANLLLPASAALATGNVVLLLSDPGSRRLALRTRDMLCEAGFPDGASAVLTVADQAGLGALLRHGSIDGVACVGDPALARLASRALAERPGALLPLIDEEIVPLVLSHFVHEKTVSVNTTASGGNAALLSQHEPD